MQSASFLRALLLRKGDQPEESPISPAWPAPLIFPDLGAAGQLP
jgi:hypothetical protein